MKISFRRYDLTFRDSGVANLLEVNMLANCLPRQYSRYNKIKLICYLNTQPIVKKNKMLEPDWRKLSNEVSYCSYFKFRIETINTNIDKVVSLLDIIYTRKSFCFGLNSCRLLLRFYSSARI